MRLDDKVCVVTGAVGAIGQATCRRLRTEGAVVVGVDRMEGDDLPVDVHHVVDLTREPAVAALYEEIVRELGRVDVLVNNAGVAADGDRSVLDTDLATWETVLRGNLTSVFLCCKHGIPKLLEAGGGSVVNLGSLVAVMGSATSQIAYTASKGGVVALSRELGIEFARRGVRVNAVCPGPVRTPLLTQLVSEDPEAWERRRVHLPMGRAANPDEVAGVVAFLASDDSSFVNATALLVDGGTAAAYVTAD